MSNQRSMNEAARLIAIDRYQILDTEAEAAFDDITRLAALICGTPIALINLIDGNRQWFKSKIGLEISELPLKVGLCHLCIEQGDVFLVPDTLADEQFATNSVVQNYPYVQFYAGAPLMTPSGNAIGTLCVVDTVARELEAEQIEGLKALSRQVVNLLELRRHVTELEDAMTKSQRAESVLRQTATENQRLAQAIATVSNGVVISDPNQPNNPIVYANPAFEKITGYPLSEVIGRSSSFLQGQDTDPQAIALLKNVFAERQEVTATLLNYRKNGQPFWNEVKISPVFSSEGNLLYFFSIHTDITDRKLAAEAIYETHRKLNQRSAELAAANEELQCTLEQLRVVQEELQFQNQQLAIEQQRYQSLFDFAPDGYLVTDTLGVIQEANQMAAVQLCLEQENLVGKPLILFIAPQDCQAFYRQLNQLKTLGQIKTWQLSLQLQERKLFPAEVTVTCIRDLSGKAIGLRWLIRDITERKLAEAALQEANETLEFRVIERTALLQKAIVQLESEMKSRTRAEKALYKEQEFLKALLENIADGIVACDENGILTLFNQAAREFYGIPQRSLPPETWAQYYNLYLSDGYTPMQTEDIPLFQALQGKTVRDVEMVIVSNKGKIRTLLANGQAIVDSQGKKLGAVVVMHDITTRKAIEAALFESESRLNSILNSIQDAVWSVSFDASKILYLNPATEKLHARPRQDFFDNPHLWHNVIHPEDRHCLENYMSLLLEQGSFEYEYRIIRADGEVRWAHNKGWLVYDQTGTPIRIDGLASDITDRKLAEKTTATLTAILEATPDFVSFADAATQRILYLNKAGRQMVGIEENEDVTTLTISDFVPESVRQLVFNESLPTAVEQGVWSGETFLRHQSGREIPVSQVLMSHKAENGEVETLSTIIRDISQQKSAEFALRQSQAFLAESQKVARVGCWEFDLATQVVTWSEELFRIFGLEPSLTPLTYEDYLQKIHPDDVEVIKKAVELTISQGKPYEFDQRILLPDGTQRYVSAKGQPIFNQEGEVIKLFGTTLDISERKAAEDKIKASLDEKETLLKEIHHRVKNNLQVIYSLLRLQSRQIQDPHTLELFQESQNRVRTMALIHEKLYQSDNLAKVDFLEYIQTLVQELSRSYNASRQAIAFKLNIEKVHLEVDLAIPCGLIINELVSNSLKYAFPDDQTGEIDISLFQHSESNKFILTIGDNGIGLPENLDFRKTQSLGLQLVCRLTKQLGGSINLTHSQGTAFQIIFAAPTHQEDN